MFISDIASAVQVLLVLWEYAFCLIMLCEYVHLGFRVHLDQDYEKETEKEKENSRDHTL